MNYSWQGASGRWYEFEVARAERVWEAVGGVYMFVKPHNPKEREFGGPICLFLAKAEDFSLALRGHVMWRSAHHLGATEVHLLTIRDARERDAAELDLLHAQTPLLNRQQQRAA